MTRNPDGTYRFATPAENIYTWLSFMAAAHCGSQKEFLDTSLTSTTAKARVSNGAFEGTQHG